MTRKELAQEVVDLIVVWEQTDAPDYELINYLMEKMLNELDQED